MGERIRVTKYDKPRRYQLYNPKQKEIRNGIYYAFYKSFQSEVATGKHCAILFDSNYRIISSSINKHRTDGVMGSIHAEEGLLGSIKSNNPNFDFTTTTLLVVRGNLLGGYSNSAPCDKCLGLMIDCGVGTIIFTSRDGELRKINNISIKSK